ncbi:MAG: circadian clock protein KaiC [ANME-2 cluster archaeon]|nr:MAG: circadian clock protein KaiC [ANME-2 cluster archaeon]
MIYLDERIVTGIYGLDNLLGGGFRKNTINIINGGIGVGKTTFGLQYLLYGLNHGEKGLFVSFEMTEKQILRDCKQLGFDEIEDHIKKGNLKILHLFGEDLIFPSLDFIEMIRESLSEDEHHRIIIDPFTHYSMFLNDDKRKSLSSIFQNLREHSTTVITLEEVTVTEPNNGLVTPLYLADTVLHLHYLGFGEYFDRTIRVVKHRGSKHGEGLYPYKIESGLGIVVIASEHDIEKVTPTKEFDKQFKLAIERSKHVDKIGKILAKRLELLRNNWSHKESPDYILKMILDSENK